MREMPPLETIILFGRNAAELDARSDWSAVRVASANNTVFVLAEVDRVPDEEDRDCLGLVATNVAADLHEGQYVADRFSTDAVPTVEPNDLEYVRCWSPASTVARDPSV